MTGNLSGPPTAQTPPSTPSTAATEPEVVLSATPAEPEVALSVTPAEPEVILPVNPAKPLVADHIEPKVPPTMRTRSKRTTGNPKAVTDAVVEGVPSGAKPNARRGGRK